MTTDSKLLREGCLKRLKEYGGMSGLNELILQIDNNSDDSLYVQIYEQIKNGIVSGELQQGTRLPSLRRLAQENGISVTTVDAAYSQLLVEGYIESRPKSGYYIASDLAEIANIPGDENRPQSLEEILPSDASLARQTSIADKHIIYDDASFDFSKWKHCMNRVFNEYSKLLQTPGEVKGEPSLRYEIAKYLYQSRGVKCSPDQIIIGAGMQQLTVQLAKILKEIGVDNAATEMPGYAPIKNCFKDEGFPLTEVPSDENGIDVRKLPTNLRTIVYVNPSNQYPTGAVMPIARRYELIKWANDNHSYIFEDDYDAELRYTGKTIPALQGLDNAGRVVYLGSFSSTLFGSIKISYMVLPQGLMHIFEQNSERYSQTCSKTEQICLALYMEEGYYHRHIKKLRHKYALKNELTTKLFEQNGGDRIQTVDSKSGVSIMLKIRTKLEAAHICQIAKDLGLKMNAIEDAGDDDVKVVCFYYYLVPDALLKMLVRMFVQNLAKAERKG